MLSAKVLVVGAVLVLGAQALSISLASCTSTTGSGTSCFSPVHGPSDTSCAGFDVGLSCPVDLEPYYTCTCTVTDAGTDAGQEWVCSPAGTGGGSGAGGSGAGGSGAGGSGAGGAAGSGGTSPGDAGADGG